jgi:uncharacterized protein (TIGR02271 family)
MTSDAFPSSRPGDSLTAAHPDARDLLGADAVEVVRSEQQLVAGVERRVGGRVRIAKRVVTEERTVTVTVRREELVVEHLPATEDGSAMADTVAPEPHGSEAVVTLVLSEEVPQVSVVAVPRERVRAYVDRVTTLEVLTHDVDLERVDVEVTDLPGGP